MRNDPKEILRLRMLEASLLPPTDPGRSELEAEIAAGESWARDEWLSLLEENERLRLELISVQIPEGLADSLMQTTTLSSGVKFGKIVHSPLLRVAATVVLLLGFGSGLFYFREQAATEKRIAEVAVLALDHYVHGSDVSVITLDPDYMARYLESSVPFPVRMPAVESDLSLIGGSSGSLGAYPAVYTRWSHQAKKQSNCAIIQFRSQDFGLPESVAREVVHSSNVNCPSAKGMNCNVVVWSEGGDGYVLVADSACALHCLGSR
jgi:hypothetical protein